MTFFLKQALITVINRDSNFSSLSSGQDVKRCFFSYCLIVGTFLNQPTRIVYYPASFWLMEKERKGTLFKCLIF